MTPELEFRNMREPGHFWADNEVIDNYGQKIGAYGLAVYMVLARSTNNETGKCSTTTRQIAKAISISPQTAMRSIAKLISVGLISEIKKSAGPEDGPSVYGLMKVEKDRSYRERTRGDRSCGEQTTVPVGNAAVPIGNGTVPVGNTNKTNNKTNKTTLSSTSVDSVPASADTAGVSLEMRKAVTEVWRYYLTKLNRDPKKYLVTDKRRQKGLQRLRECLKRTGDDLSAAVAMMKQCVDAMAASQHHVEGGYVEWDKHLFPNAEKVDYWLNKIGPRKRAAPAQAEESPWARQKRKLIEENNALFRAGKLNAEEVERLRREGLLTAEESDG